MNNETEINGSINKIEINSKKEEVTKINPNFNVISSKVHSGTILANKYVIKELINTSTSEANLYICTYKNKRFIAKIYNRQYAIKPEVINMLKIINSPYIVSVIDTGVYNGCTFEILPYYKNGSLSGRKFSLCQLKKIIIPSINEALNVLHKNNIIHKDLKPSNIMLSDDADSVILIDFGISSIIEDGNTVLVTKTGMTPEYSAPETFKNLFLEESDYYSFGITIYELFCGYTPYKNIDPEEIAKFTAVQRIPFPKEMPKELKDLILGVTYFDITNRNEKNNPNRRWTYEDVCKWCKGEKQIIPGESFEIQNNKFIHTYTFLGNSYKDIPSLINAFAKNWNDGKKQLYRGILSSFFKNFNPEIAGFCIDAEEELTKNYGTEDIIFWKLLYKIYPDFDKFYWKNEFYESISDFGNDILNRLWNNDNSKFSNWDEILNYKLISYYLENSKLKNSELLMSISAVEKLHIYSNNERNKIINYYTIGYLLSGQRIFYIDNIKIKDICELKSYMKHLIDLSYDEFKNFCNKMIDCNYVLDVQLESWLVALGKRKELELWRKQLII